MIAALDHGLPRRWIATLRQQLKLRQLLVRYGHGPTHFHGFFMVGVNRSLKSISPGLSIMRMFSNGLTPNRGPNTSKSPTGGAVQRGHPHDKLRLEACRRRDVNWLTDVGASGAH